MTDLYITHRPQRQNIAHRWNTNVLRSITGKEQRSALFTWPRMEMDVQYKRGKDDTSNWLRRHMIHDLHKIWGIPVWHDEGVLTSNASSGQNVLELDTQFRHYEKGRDVILIDKTDWTNYEVGVAATLATDQIILEENLGGSWDKADTRVMPCRDFRLPYDQTIVRNGARMDSWSIAAAEDVSGTLQYTYVPPATPATYYGHPLLDFPAQGSKQFSGRHPYDTFVSFGRSFIDTFYAGDDVHINQEFKYFIEGRENLWEMFEFFDSRMGMLSPFWAPTWNRDLIATAAIGASDTIISIKDYDYNSLFFANDIINRYLLIGMPDRTLLVRKITAASSNSITLDNALGAEIRQGQLSRLLLSFLVFSRFSSDRMEISYVRGTLGNISLRTIGLVQESL